MDRASRESLSFIAMMRRRTAASTPEHKRSVASPSREHASPFAALQRVLGNRKLSTILVDNRAREGEADRVAAGGTIASPARATPHVSALRGGQPLSDALRGQLQPRTDADLSSVRVHTDATAAASAYALGADAFAFGSDVFVGDSAPRNDHVVAHEVAHVVQQRGTQPSVQRKKSDDVDQAGPSVAFDLWNLHLELRTYEQLLAASRFVVATLREDVAGFKGSQHMRDEVAAFIQKVEDWQPYLASEGGATITPATAKIARQWLAEAGTIRTKIYGEKAEAEQAQVRRELREARERAEEGADELDKLQPRIADQLRAAFRTEKPSHIKEWAEMAGTALGVGKDLRELAEKIGEELGIERDAEGAGRILLHDPVNVHPTAVVMEAEHASKLLEGLEKLAKGLALINLALAATDHEKKATEIQEGMHSLERASSVFGALTVLLPVTAHIGLIAHLYIEPMVKAISKLIDKLVDQMHEENKDWVELTGELGRPGAEPGSNKLDPNVLFHFMQTVMRASSAEQIPDVAENIADYFVEHREAIDAAITEEVPTRGWWWWRSLDSKKAKEWLFENRARVWALLYGSTTYNRP